MKDGNLTPITEELSQEQWLIMLFSLMTDFPEKDWNEFVHDLVYKNRFSSSHKVTDIIKDFSERCTTTIKKDQIFYRARIYHQDPLREFLSDVFQDTVIKKPSDNEFNINGYYHMQLAAMTIAVDKAMPNSKKIVDTYNKWKRRRFKGYKSSESGAPPADKATLGRLNPEKIRYLYLAEDPQTAVYEVRPTIGQNVSVATFKTKAELKVYDLAADIKPQEGENLDYDYTLFRVIQQRFSEPNTGDYFRYLPTQYLGEIIKQMGFDGLRFKSSLKNGGLNLVLFDDEKCKAVCSDITKVSNIELSFVNPEIYQLDNYLNQNNIGRQ